MKTRKYLILFLLFFFFLFAGCESVDSIPQISDNTKTYELDTTRLKEEYQEGEFDLSDIKINIKNHEGIIVATIDVTSDMIANNEVESLQNIGTHTITINYKNLSKSVTYKISEEAKIYELDSSNLKSEYEVNQFKLSDLKIVVKNTLGIVLETIDVTSDMISESDVTKLQSLGSHTITINYKNLSKIISYEVKEKITIVNEYEDTKGYYKTAKGLTGNELKLELRKIISTGHKSLSYSSLNNYLQTTDRSPNEAGKILLFYTRKEIVSTWDGGSTWNKEHVWPQSKGWFTTSAAGSDAHHIRAVSSSENSSRGNTSYGVGNGYYEPKDEVKGDVARILFYLLTRYSESDSYKITSVAQSMDMLLKWNKLDPVDDIERTRNEEVYKIQGNRNPFIDYSDYAYFIWDMSYLQVSNEEIEIETKVIFVKTYAIIDDKKAYLFA